MNFTKGCSELTRAIAYALPCLNLALSPPSGGREAKAGLGLRDGFAQRRGLGWSPSMDRPPRPVTLPSLEPCHSPAIRRPRSESRVGLRDGFAKRRGLGWNPSKKGIRRPRSESRVGTARWLRAAPGFGAGAPVKKVWGGNPNKKARPTDVGQAHRYHFLAGIPTSRSCR